MSKSKYRLKPAEDHYYHLQQLEGRSYVTVSRVTNEAQAREHIKNLERPIIEIPNEEKPKKPTTKK